MPPRRGILKMFSSTNDINAGSSKVLAKDLQRRNSPEISLDCKIYITYMHHSNALTPFIVKLILH